MDRKTSARAATAEERSSTSGSMFSPNNTTPLPAKVYANEGIAQVLFFQSDESCEISYADKKGKYQAQLEVTLPRLEPGPG